MPRTPKFHVQQTTSGWMINVPATLSESGKRERHFHKTRDKAKEHASRLREKYASHGAGAAAIRPALAEDAARAMEILERWGLSLTQAAQLIDADMKRQEASVSVEEAGAAWVESLDGLRDRSIKSYKVTLKRFTSALSGRTMSTISAEEIATAIQQNGIASATQSLHRRNARAFWFWCAKKGWCEKDVFAGVPSPRMGSDKEIEFLSLDEASELLLVAEQAYPKAVPMYALALFAGIRAEELRKLEEKHVTLDGIDLPPAVTKKGRRRHITPNTTLQAWLRVYPFRPCPNWKQVDCAIRRLAGWDVAASMLECPPEPNRGCWPQNALRHSHATYAIAAGEPLEKLLFEFGHVGGIEVLRKHYVGRASKAQAAKFFALRPSMTAN
jgi:integrase